MTWLLSAVLRFLVFASIWLALSKADPANLAYGGMSVALVTGLSLMLLPPKAPTFRHWPARVWGTVLLVGWFFQQSVIGGVDVARRAMTRPVDVEPTVVNVAVALPEGAPQQLCFLLMNLLPGSMVQHVKRVDGHTFAEIHTLSIDLGPKEQWLKLQYRVAQAFQTGEV